MSKIPPKRTAEQERADQEAIEAWLKHHRPERLPAGEHVRYGRGALHDERVAKMNERSRFPQVQRYRTHAPK